MKKLVIAAVLAGLPSVAVAGNGVFTGNSDDWTVLEQWSDYTVNSGKCEFDGFIFGTWRAAFDGGGCTAIVSGPTLQLKGTAPTASLVTSTLYQGNPTIGADIDLEVKYKTISQLAGSTCTYGGSSPCTYTVGWITWNGRLDPGCNCYTFNYFILKPTVGGHVGGWEVGTDYNSAGYNGTGGAQLQNIIATAAGNYPINTLYDVEIIHSNSAQTGPGDVVAIYLGGTLLTTVTDPHDCDGTTGHKPAYTYDQVFETNCFFRAGYAVGPYEEGAQVNFPFVSATRR